MYTTKQSINPDTMKQEIPLKYPKSIFYTKRYNSQYQYITQSKNERYWYTSK